MSKFRKNTNVCEKHRVYGHQSIEKEAQAIKNLQKPKCDTCCRFADRALEAKNAHVTSENQNFDERLIRNSGETKSLRAISAEKMAQ